MAIWAIADLHLSFGIPNKNMDPFGTHWVKHAEKIEQNWRNSVSNDDLVLLAGDLSWAMRLPEVRADFKWVDGLPGTKLLIKGNHDYWWGSIGKVREALPSSIHAIQNDVFNWKGVSIGGTRLWDSDEYNFDEWIDYRGTPRKKSADELEEDRKIFERELQRLEMSLNALDRNATHRIAMTHYPPIGADLASSKAATLFEKYGVSKVVFGHLHNVKKVAKLFGEARGVHYYLTSCDYLDFKPIRIDII